MTTTLRKTSSFHWNSYGMMEYILVLLPSASVHEKILIEKQVFCHLYGEKMAIQSKPHITIARFFAKEEMEDTLNRWIHNICNRQEPFEISLNNYSGTPPHTIFIRIQDPSPVYSFMHQLQILDDYIQSSECPPLKTASKPHVTIARKLTMGVFDKAMMEYSQKEFHETFIAEELMLLKRSHEFDTSTLVNKYHFLPGANHGCYMS